MYVTAYSNERKSWCVFRIVDDMTVNFVERAESQEAAIKRAKELNIQNSEKNEPDSDKNELNQYFLF